MLGAVGAYDWNGTVLMVKDTGISMPTNDTFRDRHSERNEPLAAYLGKRNSPLATLFNKCYKMPLKTHSKGVCYRIFYVAGAWEQVYSLIFMFF